MKPSHIWRDDCGSWSLDDPQETHEAALAEARVLRDEDAEWIEVGRLEAVPAEEVCRRVSLLTCQSNAESIAEQIVIDAYEVDDLGEDFLPDPDEIRDAIRGCVLNTLLLHPIKRVVAVQRYEIQTEEK